MKRTLVVVVLSFIVLFQRCTREDDVATTQSKSKVTFSLSGPSVSASGRVSTGGIAGVSHLVLSLITPTGEEVLTHQQVNITPFGDGYISEPVELTAGYYKIADFYLVNDSMKVIYASPHKGSFLGKLLKHPLDQEFRVNPNKVTELAVEVVKVEGFSPTDFGYSSFSVAAQKFFPVSIHITKNGRPTFTDATVYVLHHGDTISNNAFGPSINLVKFDALPDDTCTLSIIKDGYGHYSKQFTPRSIASELGNRPLNIMLNPAVTFWITTLNPVDWDNSYSNYFMADTTGILTFDWGDGQVEDVPIVQYIPEFITANPLHIYQTTNTKHFVSITGDLALIKGIDANPINFRERQLNLKAFTNLTWVNFFFGNASGLLDLRDNQKLVSVVGTGDSMLLPKVHHINYLGIEGRPELARQIDYFVDNIYRNAVAFNTMNGTFNMSGNAEGTEEPGNYVGNPSPASWNKLRRLRDIYHWSIIPNP